jgi:histidinol-phosphate aminotransferase
VNPLIRFDAAINPHGCSPAVVAALEQAVRDRGYRHYGDVDAAALRARLAAHHGLSPENFLVYNGCGEGWVWQCLTRLLLTQGTFICPAPSYERFVAVAQRCARQIVEVPLHRPGWGFPLTQFIDRARASGAALAMISSPNNPTGNRLLDQETLEALLQALPACTVVVDEAYAEYTGTTFAPLVNRFANLVVLKTFSKAYGLAGLRVGYVVAPYQLTAEARRFQLPWAVDTLALVAAEAALDDQAYLRDTVARINREVTQFGRALADLHVLRLSPTEANFYLGEFIDGVHADGVVAALARRSLAVRRRADMPQHIRVTCMTAPENGALLDALAAVRA